MCVIARYRVNYTPESMLIVQSVDFASAAAEVEGLKEALKKAKTEASAKKLAAEK